MMCKYCVWLPGVRWAHSNCKVTKRIFKSGSKWLKDKSFYKYFNGLDAMIEPYQYRTYRTHLAPLYAQRAIDGLAPKLRSDLTNSASGMMRQTKNGQTVNMAKVFRTLSVRIIQVCALASS